MFYIIEEISVNRLQNPQQSKPYKPFYKKWWFWLIIIFVLLVIYCVQRGYIGSSENQKNVQVNTEATSVILNEGDFKNICEEIDYKALARNPDKHKGNNYHITGKVIQVQESSLSNTVELRINMTKEVSKYTDYVSWSDTIYCTVEIPDGADRILEGDIITFWGTCDGLYSYTSVLGSTISLPKIDIKYYEISD